MATMIDLSDQKTRKARPAPDVPAIAKVSAPVPTATAKGFPSITQPMSAGSIYRRGDRFSDISIAGGVKYAPSASSVSSPAQAQGIADLTRLPNLAKPAPLTRTATAAIAGGIGDVGALSQPAGSGVRSIADMSNGLAAGRRFLADREAERNEARARQQFDIARSTAAESAIAKRNSLENASREARIAAGGLRLVSGGRTQRMLMGKSIDLKAQAASAADDIGNLDFVRAPEQEASLALGKRHGAAHAALEEQQAIAAGIGNVSALRDQAIMDQLADIGSLSPAARSSLERYVQISQGRSPAEAPAETFGNPVDETDTTGNAIRAQYGNRGTRRVIEGARPLPKSGAGVMVGPDGTLIAGGGVPKLTEQQSKDLVFFTRGSEALKNLEGRGDALADPVAKAGASVPLIGNKLAGDKYQRAEQAGRDFLAAVLRKDTGAAITKQEMDLYGKTFLPQPFDTPETLKQKAAARQTALEAIKLGLGPAQQLVPEDERGARGGNAQAQGQDDDAASALLAEIEAYNARRQKEKRRAVMEGLTNVPTSESDLLDYSDLWK
ncbi:MAG: hypothetical protein AB1651_16510 [Pseudomonadota bacterium]